MTPDIDLIYEIPQEVKDAALLLGNYFKEKGLDSWTLYDVCSRNAYLAGHKMGYNSGLTVAVSLAEECGASRTLICGLENSKK
jgi:hypothetical protein